MGFDPRGQIAGAFRKRPQQPTQLVWVLGNMVEVYERWVGFGRPSVEEYERLDAEQLVAEAEADGSLPGL